MSEPKTERWTAAAGGTQVAWESAGEGSLSSDLVQLAPHPAPPEIEAEPAKLPRFPKLARMLFPAPPYLRGDPQR